MCIFSRRMSLPASPGRGYLSLSVRLREAQIWNLMSRTPGIKKLGRDYYFVQVSRTDPRTGKRRFRRRWVRGSYGDALDVREQALAELENEIAGVSMDRPTVTAYVQRWLEARASKLKPSTREKYVNDLSKHILPKIGNYLIADLRPRDIEIMLSKDPGAPNSKKNRLAVLRCIAKDALADEVTERDFCARVSIKVPPVYTDAEPNLLDAEQTSRLLSQIPLYWLDVSCVLAYTGLRWGEVSGLRWVDLDLDEACASINWTNWKGRLVKPKTDASARTIPLVEPLPTLLRLRYARMLAGPHPQLAHGLVFPTQEGGLHKGTPLNRVFRLACKRAGITIRFTPHGIRRTWNDLARRVNDQMIVRSMIGHVSEEMTEHYSRVDLDEKRMAAKRVQQMLDRKQDVTVQVTPAPGNTEDEDHKPE